VTVVRDHPLLMMVSVLSLSLLLQLAQLRLLLAGELLSVGMARGRGRHRRVQGERHPGRGRLLCPDVRTLVGILLTRIKRLDWDLGRCLNCRGP
jgi:hypothetical protein